MNRPPEELDITSLEALIVSAFEKGNITITEKLRLKEMDLAYTYFKSSLVEEWIGRIVHDHFILVIGEEYPTGRLCLSGWVDALLGGCEKYDHLFYSIDDSPSLKDFPNINKMIEDITILQEIS